MADQTIATTTPQTGDGFLLLLARIAKALTSLVASSPGAAPTNSATTLVTSNATTIAARSGRVKLTVQNLKAGSVLYVKEGAGASASSFSYILVGGTAQDDGYGASIATAWPGVVSFYDATTARCVAVESY